MANATYTPTHCPETGRKFTKAERKAANKAKYAAERAAQAALKPKSKRKAKAQKASPKPKAVSVPTRKAKLMRMTKAELVDLIIGTEPPAPKRKPKAQTQQRRGAGAGTSPHRYGSASRQGAEDQSSPRRDWQGSAAVRASYGGACGGAQAGQA